MLRRTTAWLGVLAAIGCAVLLLRALRAHGDASSTESIIQTVLAILAAISVSSSELLEARRRRRDVDDFVSRVGGSEADRFRSELRANLGGPADAGVDLPLRCDALSGPASVSLLADHILAADPGQRVLLTGGVPGAGRRSRPCRSPTGC